MGETIKLPKGEATLVERLRGWPFTMPQVFEADGTLERALTHDDYLTVAEAADKIERLRARITSLERFESKNGDLVRKIIKVKRDHDCHGCHDE